MNIVKQTNDYLNSTVIYSLPLSNFVYSFVCLFVYLFIYLIVNDILLILYSYNVSSRSSVGRAWC